MARSQTSYVTCFDVFWSILALVGVEWTCAPPLGEPRRRTQKPQQNPNSKVQVARTLRAKTCSGPSIKNTTKTRAKHVARTRAASAKKGATTGRIQVDNGAPTDCQRPSRTAGPEISVKAIARDSPDPCPLTKPARTEKTGRNPPRIHNKTPLRTLLFDVKTPF